VIDGYSWVLIACDQLPTMFQEGGFGPGQMKTVVGSPNNFWIWSRESGWDLTHPPTPDAEPLQPRIPLECEISNIAIDPTKTALMIIDMQNFSMCCALKTDMASVLLQAQDTLLKYGIPAARTAKIQIIWLNWGLTERDMETMTPGAMRVFSWKANTEAVDYGISTRSTAAKGMEEFIRCGEIPRAIGLGADLGEIVLEDGTKVDAGRVLMRGTWNAALHGPLASAFEKGQAASRPDVLIHKNRNSGLSDAMSDCTEYLKREGIRTLLFTGMNTDQCVMGTLQDAHSKGFDTVLLRDGCATDSPRYAQQSAEFNCCRNWGFLSTCKALAKAASLL
jgi:nicotinamidase-related amidase